ncbi:MAG: DNA methylase N-4 [Gammaproteobacteria bacterium GWE2_37_16]|nr:MAG: DNA methylase N-4 [Gammaproteobacteria bacterium GWE2_37_16]
MSKKQKLELTWIGKDQEIYLEPRILLEDHERSYGDQKTDNMLIHGDNLLALKALEQDFSGKIKCIYIDPPYNTGNAFEHYDDGIEHSLWLSLMKPRLELFRKLLANDGSIWISIDDDECHYLKVLCDEVFGRGNFVSSVIWMKKSSPQNDAKWISDTHDHILVYAKNKETWRPNKLPRTQEQNSIYKHSDMFDGINNDGSYYGRGPWFPGDMTVKTISDNALYEITTPSGRMVKPADGRCWVYTKTKFEQLIADHRITFGKDGNNKPCIKRFITEIEDRGIVPKSVWLYQEVGENRNARQEVKAFNIENPFATPKPERLIERILTLATSLNDLVLDSFLGSGTTSAVANKMGRRWIGIELGEHCYTHCLPRLQKVCEGTDQGGISKAVNWQGGGGFKFYELAPSLLKKDKYDNLIIDERYNADMLAAAVAKHEGFKYCPHVEIYWKQGKATENAFIFTTSQMVTVAMLDRIYEEMHEGESLLICAKSYQSECTNTYPNITIKKIPNILLGRCEFDKNDYSLNIINMPIEEEDSE